MKKYIYKLSILLFVFAFVGCSSFDDDLETTNTDTKNPTEVPGGPLFTNGVRNYFDLMLGTNVNSNVFRLYAQYWSQTTYPDESQYNQVTRNIGRNMWRTIYRDVLKDISGAAEIVSAEALPGIDPAAEEAQKKNKLAVIDIVKVLSYSTLVDLFGDVPYTEALDETNPSPKYDDAATIYADLMVTLNTAIANIDQTVSGFDSEDPVYEGDMAMWYKMANSLKLRLALRLADVDASAAKTNAEAAAANVISDNSENFTITYYSTSPNTHPLWVDLVQSGRKDFIGANVLTDVMNNVADPRMFKYFTPKSFKYNKDDNGDDIDTELVGSGSIVQIFKDVNGKDSLVTLSLPHTFLAADAVEFDYFQGGIYGTANASSKFSQIGDLLKEPDLPGTLLSYSEVEFLLAEAAARGYAVGGTEESHYNAGVLASMDEWGVDSGDAATYLAQADVAYATAAGDWKQKIGSQKWLAMYNMAFEGWTTWRLLDFQNIMRGLPADIDDNGNVTSYDAISIPYRFIYPIEEATLNQAQLDAAAAAIGGDLKTTKIFWDVN